VNDTASPFLGGVCHVAPVIRRNAA
jgi:hypothetical protein